MRTLFLYSKYRGFLTDTFDAMLPSRGRSLSKRTLDLLTMFHFTLDFHRMLGPYILLSQSLC